MNTFDRDVVVIGAGFGGLATALRLAEEGARVTLAETLRYPGGCASTFEHKGYQFEAGATLFSGFGEGQLFRRFIDDHDLPVEVDTLDPMVELRTPEWKLPIPPRRDELLTNLCALPDAPVERLRAFFAYQRRIADTLWSLLDDPELLPPFGPRTLARHVQKLHNYLPFLRIVGRPLSTVLRRFGLEKWRPLRTYLDALCQITVQCGVDEAEAPFALGTMDYYFRGTGHVRGGIGRLAEALVDAIRRRGGEVLLANRVRSLEPLPGGGFRVKARQGGLTCRAVAANLLPQDVARLLKDSSRIIRRTAPLAWAVRRGWGACMIYRVLRPAPGTDGPHHLELVQDPSRPLLEGNHLFCSLSGPEDGDRAPAGFRSLTVSTHVPLERLTGLANGAQADYIAEVQQRMRRGLAEMVPEWEGEILHEMTASPRTFARFTGREGGAVGGVPRRAGLSNYAGLIPRPLLPGLHLVGDSVFPGQSTLATALGGVKLAERLLSRMG